MHQNHHNDFTNISINHPYPYTRNINSDAVNDNNDAMAYDQRYSRKSHKIYQEIE